ncbi:MAG: hypothetical protein EP330_19455 [Deltaproteobacteria bacterium]|nr:MAG: hypothetical protein EP330_19455 [Deltaproteobacteria bacterium]
MGTWIGAFPNGIETQLFLGGEVTVRPRVAPFAYGGVHRHASGEVDLRDSNVGLVWTPVWTPNAMLRFRPGLSLPTGGLTSSFLFTPLSTASIDPWLAADWMVGGTWIVGGSLVTRVPLYDGWDLRRQGAFTRADGRLSRRLGLAVPWLGLSVVHQAKSRPAGASPDFAELAASAGSVFALHERWSVTAQLRLPLVVTAGTARQLTGGVALRWVVGNRDRDEDEEEHE